MVIYRVLEIFQVFRNSDFVSQSNELFVVGPLHTLQVHVCIFLFFRTWSTYWSYQLGLLHELTLETVMHAAPLNLPRRIKNQKVSFPKSRDCANRLFRTRELRHVFLYFFGWSHSIPSDSFSCSTVVCCISSFSKRTRSFNCVNSRPCDSLFMVSSLWGCENISKTPRIRFLDRVKNTAAPMRLTFTVFRNRDDTIFALTLRKRCVIIGAAFALNTGTSG